MANSPQAIKRDRQNEKHRLLNTSHRSSLRTTVKKVREAIATGDATLANAAFRVAQKNLDTNAKRGIVHKNKAARLKSRLNAQIKALVVKG